MADKDTRPFFVLTVLLDASARAAAVTRSHGDALERAINASAGHAIAGLDLVELPIAPAAFMQLRRHLGLPEDTIGLYDIFPLASHLDAQVRKIAGQFLAAEALWTLDEQGALGGVPLNLKLDLPPDWDRDPKKIHQRLLDAGALDLSAEGVETYKKVKEGFDRAAPAQQAG
ncbi:MAG: hypothetical protein ACOC9O_01660 [Myxococcota bacterium]